MLSWTPQVPYVHHLQCYCIGHPRNEFHAPYPLVITLMLAFAGLGPTPAQEIIATYRQYIWINSINVAVRVLLLYDYLVTIDREVQLIWGHTLSITSVLFMANRYLNIIISILELFQQGRFNTNQSCMVIARIGEGCLISSLLVVAAFATLRVYAIWCRNWRPALPVLVLALIPFVIGTYIYSHITPTLAPPLAGGCALKVKLPVNLFRKYINTARACTIAYDILVMILTCYKTFLIRESSSRMNIKAPVILLLLRDGTVFFFALLIVSVIQMIMVPKVKVNDVIPYFVSPLTSILMSRFILNLREIYLPEDLDFPRSTSVFSSAHLSSGALGNIAAPLSMLTSSSSSVLPEIWEEPLIAGLGESSQVAPSEFELDAIPRSDSWTTP